MHQHSSSFCGASGTNYNYGVLSCNFKPENRQFYNYMFANLSPEGDWILVFIGQGDLKQYLSDRDYIHVAAASGFTHVLAHMSPDEQQRRREALDILASYPHVHAFMGCNANSLANALLLNAAKIGGYVVPVNKISKRFLPDEQAFKNRALSSQSLDTVWTRLRAKNKG